MSNALQRCSRSTEISNRSALCGQSAAHCSAYHQRPGGPRSCKESGHVGRIHTRAHLRRRTPYTSTPPAASPHVVTTVSPWSQYPGPHQPGHFFPRRPRFPFYSLYFFKRFRSYAIAISTTSSESARGTYVHFSAAQISTHFALMMPNARYTFESSILSVSAISFAAAPSTNTALQAAMSSGVRI
jgi:hypothetical protein